MLCSTARITIGVLFPVSLYLISQTVSQMLSCLSFTSDHTPHAGSCPECTDQTPVVVALGAVLVIVTVLLAVAIVIIALQYIRESQCCQKAFI